MAATAEGRELTEAHRRAQQEVRDDFLAEFIAVWALLDSTRLDETGPGWVAAVLRLIRSFRRDSAGVATEYYWRFRDAETAPQLAPQLAGAASTGGGAGPPASSGPVWRGERPSGEDVIPQPRRSQVRFEIDEDALLRAGRNRARFEFEIPDLDEERNDRAAEVSLTVTGPANHKAKSSRGARLRQARDDTFVESSGAASRHVLTGGRQSLLTLLADDPQVQRWVRVTDEDPCAFCAMLASRGAVYLSQASAKFEAHDACACTAEGVYYANAPWPGRASELRRLWREHIEGRYSGKEALREWRKVYRDLQREQRRAA